MLRFRLLESLIERRAFFEAFCLQLADRSGGALSIEPRVERIAHCTRVVGVFDRRGRMVGGYIVNDGPNLVLLSVVPEPERAAWTARVDLADVCELNLIWRNDGIGHTAFALAVWPRIIADCVTRGRRYILGSGYANPLDRWYRALDPELIFSGPSTTSGLHIYVYAFTRTRMVGTWFASAFDSFVLRPLRRAGRR